MRAIIALLFCVFALAGCGSSEARPIDGQWAADGFNAEVGDNRIQIEIVTSDTAGLYWDGNAPTGVNFVGEFFSDANERALERSLLGSTADTKVFKYDPRDDSLSFSFTMMGTTKTVQLRRV